MLSKVNYNKISKTYDNRYLVSPLEGVENELKNLIVYLNPKSILEVGCGTGHWISIIKDKEFSIIGIDYSKGMLGKAKNDHQIQNLVCADAQLLPVKEKSVDLIYSINAIHHFNDPFGYMKDAMNILCPGGTFAIMGLEPSAPHSEWFLWKYFRGTYEYDLNRCSSFEKLKDQMTEIGFRDIITKEVQRISYTMINEEVLKDNFIEKAQSSQLAALSNSEYEAGVKMIHDDIDNAKRSGTNLEFRVNLIFKSITAVTPEN